MAVVTMPQLGESVAEGTILHWLKQPGEPVQLDDPLCEIETEKVTAELPSQYAGTMGRQLVAEGETVKVGAPLCELEEAGATPPPAAPPPAAAAPAPLDAAPAGRGVQPGGGWSGGPMAIPPDEPAPAAANGAGPRESAPAAAPTQPAGTQPAQPAPAAAPATAERSRFYSPAVLRLAADSDVQLESIQGTGIGGRVTRKDVEAAIAAGTAPVSVAPAAAPASAAAGARPAQLAADRSGGAGYEVVELTPTRRRIAENLARSNREAPQAWMMVEADVTGLVRLREREKERFQVQEGVPLTLLPYFSAAVCEALRDEPALNARWHGDELRRYASVGLGIAVAAATGLVVPVVHGAGDLSVAGLARHIADLAGRAHARKLRLDDIDGGTFTVDNTGAFGSIASKPIVNHPQVAIVTMERAVKRAVVREDDSIAIRWLMNVCLSFDHRALDGLEAGNFMSSLKRRLEAIA